MGQTVFVPKEADANESRVAASPDTVKRLAGLGLDVIVESGAGTLSRITDDEFAKAGAKIGKAGDAAKADVVLKVRRPTDAELKGYKSGAAVIATMDPYGNDAAIAAMAKAGVTAFAMEFMPRITRAQVMDVLSSQANLAGYQAVVDAAAEYDRALPMMMTAAGTVPAAKVFVMGVGVAGLQAIATARRMGAVVTATDVRPAAKEQVASLGAKFLAVEDEEFKAAETAGGYAKEMSNEYQAKQAVLTADHIAKQDIVITTALIPGRPAPRLVSAAMVQSMKPGSVIVDLAVERGGNVEGAVPGRVVTSANGVKIVGHLNVPGRVAASASLLYARNLFAFLETMVDKTTKQLAINPEDELVKATMLTDGGKIVHSNFADTAALAPKSEPAAAKLANIPAKSVAMKSGSEAAYQHVEKPKDAGAKTAKSAAKSGSDAPYKHVEKPEPAAKRTAKAKPKTKATAKTEATEPYKHVEKTEPPAAKPAAPKSEGDA